MSGGHKPGNTFKATVLSVTGTTAVIETDEEDIEYLAGIIGVESVFHVTVTGPSGGPSGDVTTSE
jgi:hypothetical protein